MTGKTIAAALALGLAAGGAQALTLGGVSFDDDAFADAASLAGGSPAISDFSGLVGARLWRGGGMGIGENNRLF